MLRNRVRELRARDHLTQADLANKIGATRQTVGMIEKADYAPSVALALKISSVFNVALEEVFWLESEDEAK